LPPYAGDRSTARLRSCTPVPQDTVQRSHEPHRPTAQSTLCCARATCSNTLLLGATAGPALSQSNEPSRRRCSNAAWCSGRRHSSAVRSKVTMPGTKTRTKLLGDRQWVRQLKTQFEATASDCARRSVNQPAGLGSLKYSLAPPNAPSTALMRSASVHA
jgi:hypothetical protein